jgi:hypothetical protein
LAAAAQRADAAQRLMQFFIAPGAAWAGPPAGVTNQQYVTISLSNVASTDGAAAVAVPRGSDSLPAT